ncbi:MAG TPA: hypothetical protein VMW46_12120, partial [Candidatus Desulfaltia sp.]|nr:hypothetical protein [Candidatus Desulfaltia sp.]
PLRLLGKHARNKQKDGHNRPSRLSSHRALLSQSPFNIHHPARRVNATGSERELFGMNLAFMN